MSQIEVTTIENLKALAIRVVNGASPDALIAAVLGLVEPAKKYHLFAGALDAGGYEGSFESVAAAMAFVAGGTGKFAFSGQYDGCDLFMTGPDGSLVKVAEYATKDTSHNGRDGWYTLVPSESAAVDLDPNKFQLFIEDPRSLQHICVLQSADLWDLIIHAEMHPGHFIVTVVTPDGQDDLLMEIARLENDGAETKETYQLPKDLMLQLRPAYCTYQYLVQLGVGGRARGKAHIVPTDSLEQAIQAVDESAFEWAKIFQVGYDAQGDFCGITVLSTWNRDLIDNSKTGWSVKTTEIEGSDLIAALAPEWRVQPLTPLLPDTTQFHVVIGHPGEEIRWYAGGFVSWELARQQVELMQPAWAEVYLIQQNPPLTFSYGELVVAEFDLATGLHPDHGRWTFHLRADLVNVLKPAKDEYRMLVVSDNGEHMRPETAFPASSLQSAAEQVQALEKSGIRWAHVYWIEKEGKRIGLQHIAEYEEERVNSQQSFSGWTFDDPNIDPRYSPHQ